MAATNTETADAQNANNCNHDEHPQIPKEVSTGGFDFVFICDGCGRRSY